MDDDVTLSWSSSESDDDDLDLLNFGLDVKLATLADGKVHLRRCSLTHKDIVLLCAHLDEVTLLDIGDTNISLQSFELLCTHNCTQSNSSLGLLSKLYKY
jgi:hypothetical protein